MAQTGRAVVVAARISVEAPALATAAEGPGLLVGRAASTLVLDGAPGIPAEGAAAMAAGSLRLAPPLPRLC